MKLEIFRQEHRAYHEMGSLRIDGALFCVTLEPPWMQNRPFISCIPAGCYKAVRCNSPKYGNTFEIVDVEGRSLILFHPGNWPSQTEGCVLLGQYPAKLRGKRAVANSGNTFHRFMEQCKGVDSFDLFIVEI